VLERDFASPVLVRAWPSRSYADGFESTVDVVLCGRTATESAALMHETMESLGRAGVGPIARPVGFRVARVGVEFEGHLMEIAGPEPEPGEELMLELVTPAGSDPSRISKANQSRFLTPSEERTRFPLGWLLGNVADDLVRWDIEDRGLTVVYGKDASDELAVRARKAAETAARQLVISGSAIFKTRQTMDSRSSTSSRGNGVHPLVGCTGHLLLSGDLRAVWPWLLGAAVRGFAQQRAKGFGRVRLWRACS
jgi:hypothetical protein